MKFGKLDQNLPYSTSQQRNVGKQEVFKGLNKMGSRTKKGDEREKFTKN